MLKSLALIFLFGLLLGSIFKKLKLPAILGMLVTGIILSPYALNLLDSSILSVSGDLRQLALVIILTRAGLKMDINALKKVGRPAILMSFLPALCEILGVVLLAPVFFNVSIIEALIMGTVIAAVSPAIVVPRMINLAEKNYGTAKSIPQLIMAGSSIDDIFVIVLFTSFTKIAEGAQISANVFFQIPVSIILGIIVGITLGILLTSFFKYYHMRDSIKVIIILSISFLLITLENSLKEVIQISALLAIMSMSATLLKTYDVLAERLSDKFSKLWVGAEIILFVLVGANVDFKYALSSGILVLMLVIFALLFRAAGVIICLIKADLNFKERTFCVFAYLPKATVQAAIGAIPLSMGLPCGKIVLTVAVVAILITAPLGALLIDNTYEKLLLKTDI